MPTPPRIRRFGQLSTAENAVEAKRLEESFTLPDGRTVTGRMLLEFEIEKQLGLGRSQSDISKSLKAQGLEVNDSYLKGRIAVARTRNPSLKPDSRYAGMEASWIIYSGLNNGQSWDEISARLVKGGFNGPKLTEIAKQKMAKQIQKGQAEAILASPNQKPHEQNINMGSEEAILDQAGARAVPGAVAVGGAAVASSSNGEAEAQQLQGFRNQAGAMLPSGERDTPYSDMYTEMATRRSQGMTQQEYETSVFENFPKMSEEDLTRSLLEIAEELRKRDPFNKPAEEPTMFGGTPFNQILEQIQSWGNEWYKGKGPPKLIMPNRVKEGDPGWQTRPDEMP